MPLQPSANDSEALRYILLVLEHTDQFKPSWNAIAEAEGLSRGAKAYVLSASHVCAY